MDFRSLVQELYGIEESIVRRLWPESSLLESKGKKPTIGQRSGEGSAISATRPRPSRHYQTIGQTSGVYYPPSPHMQYRPLSHFRAMTSRYLHPTT